MTTERKPTKAVNIIVRNSADGYTRSIVQFAGVDSMPIVTIHTAAHDASQEVRDALIKLSTAVMHQMLREALPEFDVSVVAVVNPTAPADHKAH